MASRSKPLICLPPTPPWASRGRPAPTETEGPGGTPPWPCVGPDHPAGPDTHPLWPPALRTSCLKSLYSAKACRPRARTLGRTTVLEPQPLRVPGPGWAHQANASGPSNKDVLRLRLPLLLAGSRTPERGARPQGWPSSPGRPGSRQGQEGPRAAQHREAAQTHPQAGPQGDASQR